MQSLLFGNAKRLDDLRNIVRAGHKVNIVRALPLQGEKAVRQSTW